MQCLYCQVHSWVLGLLIFLSASHSHILDPSGSFTHPSITAGGLGKPVERQRACPDLWWRGRPRLLGLCVVHVPRWESCAYSFHSLSNPLLNQTFLPSSPFGGLGSQGCTSISPALPNAGVLLLRPYLSFLLPVTSGFGAASAMQNLIGFPGNSEQGAEVREVPQVSCTTGYHSRISFRPWASGDADWLGLSE